MIVEFQNINNEKILNPSKEEIKEFIYKRTKTRPTTMNAKNQCPEERLFYIFMVLK